MNKLEEKTGKKLKDKEKISWRANFLRGMLQAGAFGASAALGSAAPLIGARALSSATAPDQLQAHLDSVTSADMVGLAKQIEDEQSNLLTNYLRLRQAIEAQQTAQYQVDVMQRMGSDLPQTDGNKLSQYFALNELTARRLAEAESDTENARTALMMMSNHDVVTQVEQQIQAQMAEKAKL